MSLLEKFCKPFISLVPLLLKQKILKRNFLEVSFLILRSQFLFKSRVGNETRLMKLGQVSNYGKFICNIFSWDTVKIGIIRAKVQISVRFKMMGCSRVFSTCMGIVSLLLVKCRQGLSNRIKNPHCFVSVSFCVQQTLRICVCLNRTKPWFELSIKFIQHSLRSFQKALVGFNNL